MMKNLKEFAEELTEMKTYDISDWDEDGIDDMVNMELDGLKAGKDYTIKSGKLCCKTDKACKAVKGLFDK